MSDKIRLIEQAGDKLSNNREFMAFYLEKFQEIELINQQDLCLLLNCSQEEYYNLALCKAPKADSEEFISRLNNIGHYTGVSILGLSNILKRVNAVLAISKQTDRNYLIAARDKNKQKNEGN